VNQYDSFLFATAAGTRNAVKVWKVMNNSQHKLSRSAALKALAAIPAAIAGALSGRLVADAAKGSKAQYRYQNLPKHGQRCAACRFFIKGKTPVSRGACTLVAGSISPIGWCIAFAKKR